MAWMGYLGAAVAGAIGVSIAASSIAAGIIGGLIVGAAAGAMYTAWKGGNLFKNMAFGALGGAALGGIGAAAAGGGWVTASATQTAASATSSVYAAGGAAAGVNGATGAASTTSGLLGGAAVGGSNLQGIGGLAGLGAGYLNGLQATKDRKADQAWKEKQFELENKGIDAQLTAAEMAASTSRENALTAAETAGNQLEFARDKFSKEFTEDKRRYDTDRQDAQDLRDQFRQSVVAGSQYASGATPTIRPLELKRQRMELPQPSWITGKNQQVAQAQPAQPQRGLLAEQQAQGLPKPQGLPA